MNQYERTANRKLAGKPAELNFLEGIKDLLTSSTDTPLVFLGNFEVEDQWARGEVGLPSVGGASVNSAIVNRMEELALLLGGRGDHVILKSEPDPEHLSYLNDLGVDLPTIHVAEIADPRNIVTLDALASPRLLAALKPLTASGARLLPHGTSELEERLCRVTGLQSTLPDAQTTKTVNSKIYSRELCDSLGIVQAHGWACRTLAEFEHACTQAREVVQSGARVGIKDAYGVSGKGILILDSVRKIDQILRMVRRSADRTGDDRISVVVEVWADKAVDLNYHFTVGKRGEFKFDFAKEAITKGGVHKGHRIPAQISPAQLNFLIDTSERVGERLAADGFYGLVGIDAIVQKNGEILPVLEINARSNMSTYTVRLQEHVLPNYWSGLACQYPLRLTEKLSFAQLKVVLGDLLLRHVGASGLVVQGMGTVNAGALEVRAGGAFAGRLHGLLVGPDAATVAQLDGAISTRLHEWSLL